MSDKYRLDILGTCRLTSSGGSVIEFRTRKAKCLLGIVALSPDCTISRERLASMLWDPAPDEQARASLRQCLREIRDVMGEESPDVLIADRLQVRLDTASVTVDALELIEGLKPAESDIGLAVKLGRLWRGELFGDTVPAAPMFEAWVQVERSRLRTLVSSRLTDHLESCIHAGDFNRSELAEELLRIEPSHELAHQYLMRFHAQRGDQAASLRQYALLNRVLADELDSEPSRESTDLLVAIKRGDLALGNEAPRPQPALPERKGPPTITIRPPLTRSNDSARDYLADGFADLTKVCLSKFRCWIILSWPSSGFDSQAKIDYPALHAAIGADYVIDSVLDWRQPQGRLYISLIDCRDGGQVWSDVLNVNEQELQSVGNTVAGAVASNLASRINHIALLRYARSTPGNAAAYDMWLKGHQLSRLWNREADEQAIRLFGQAIELDPGLACSYASLAAVLNTQGMIRPGYADENADKKRAFELAQNAISLDPFDSRNHITMAWSWLQAGSGERAESHFKLAVDLNPYDSETLIASAMGLAFLGHIERARDWAEAAVKLNPLHPGYFTGYLASIRYLSGDLQETIRLVSLNPDVFPETLAWAAAAHAKLGHAEEASSFFGRFVNQVGDMWEGKSKPPRWDDLSAWLLRALPFGFDAGRKDFESGLLRARSLYEDMPRSSLTGTSS
jgi:DNA-binding SARP family transcriptional activator